jgi:Fic family protein
MQPPYTINPEILQLVTELAHKTGELNASLLIKQAPALRKRNRIRTIQASLAIEGNTLSIDQVTAIIENKRVLGPAKDIREVTNAILVYDQLDAFNPVSEKSFLKAHQLLMKGLIPEAGRYRRGGAGIVKGASLTHLAPRAANVPMLMKDLFRYLKNNEELLLIKSCVFHYELEFIHPFADGNGRMGRLWQTLILMRQFPVLAYLPFESLIAAHQKDYYRALSISDKQGTSTFFIAFMLRILREALDELLSERTGSLHAIDRIRIFLETGVKEFTRKDYMRYFKMISPATASRDLLLAVNEKKVKRFGDKNKAVYRVK